MATNKKTMLTLTQTQIDRSMMKRAFDISHGSHDPKRHIDRRTGVGAVIAEKDRIISESANVFPPGTERLKDAIAGDSPERYHFIEHAERAAIYLALKNGRGMDNATIYCTRFPCSDCARAIVFSGIRRMVVASGFAGEGPWASSQRHARQLLREAKVTMRYLKNADS